MRCTHLHSLLSRQFSCNKNSALMENSGDQPGKLLRVVLGMPSRAYGAVHGNVIQAAWTCRTRQGFYVVASIRTSAVAYRAGGQLVEPDGLLPPKNVRPDTIRVVVVFDDQCWWRPCSHSKLPRHNTALAFYQRSRGF